MMVAGLLIGMAEPVQNEMFRDRITSQDEGQLWSTELTVEAEDVIAIEIKRLSGDLIPFVGIQADDGQFVLRASGDATGQLTTSHTFETAGIYTLVITGEIVDDRLTTGDFLLNLTGEDETAENFVTISANDDPILILAADHRIDGQLPPDGLRFYYVYLEDGQTLTSSLQGVANQIVISDLDEDPLDRSDLGADVPFLQYESEADSWYILAVIAPTDVSETDDLSYQLYVTIE